MVTPTGTRTAQSEPSPRITTVILTPTFKLIFLGVLGITVLSMLLSCYLLASAPRSVETTALMNAFMSIFKLGFGALIGLMGGKAVQ